MNPLSWEQKTTVGRKLYRSWFLIVVWQLWHYFEKWFQKVLSPSPLLTESSLSRKSHFKPFVLSQFWVKAAQNLLVDPSLRNLEMGQKPQKSFGLEPPSSWLKGCWFISEESPLIASFIRAYFWGRVVSNATHFCCFFLPKLTQLQRDACGGALVFFSGEPFFSEIQDKIENQESSIVICKFFFIRLSIQGSFKITVTCAFWGFGCLIHYHVFVWVRLFIAPWL